MERKAKLWLAHLLISDEIAVLYLETDNLLLPGETALNLRSPNPPNGEVQGTRAQSSSQGTDIASISLACVHAPVFHRISTWKRIMTLKEGLNLVK